MERHCINSKSADQNAHHNGLDDDRELAIERLEIALFDQLEHCIYQSKSPDLAEFIDRFSDQIGGLLREIAKDRITQKAGI